MRESFDPFLIKDEKWRGNWAFQDLVTKISQGDRYCASKPVRKQIKQKWRINQMLKSREFQVGRDLHDKSIKCKMNSQRMHFVWNVEAIKSH